MKMRGFRVLAAALVFVLVLCAVPGDASSVSEQKRLGYSAALEKTRGVFTGSGTEGDPFVIRDNAGLRTLAELLNKGDAAVLAKFGREDVYYKLAGDFSQDAPYGRGAGEEPIGNGAWMDNDEVDLSYKCFAGHLDGNGRTVALDMDTPGGGAGQRPGFAGLFGYLERGVVENLTVSGSVVSGDMSEVGGIVGHNSGEIRNCVSFADAKCGDRAYAGSFVGVNGGRISDCSAGGNVSGGNNFTSVGGFAGEAASSSVMDCYATGEVTAGDGARAGAFAGMNGSLMENCYATGNVTAGGDYAPNHSKNGSSAQSAEPVMLRNDEVVTCYAGGLVGYKYFGTVTDCYATGRVTAGNNACAGGLVGRQNGTNTRYSYSTASVTAGSGAIAGGIVGSNGGGIEECRATGRVTVGDGGVAGGIAGLCDAGRAIMNGVEYCTAEVTVTGGADSVVGGIVGINIDGITNSRASCVVAGGDRTHSGGLAGDNAGILANSCVTGGTVSGGRDAAVGGLAGRNVAVSDLPDRTGGKVLNCYAAADIISGNFQSKLPETDSLSGGLVGIGMDGSSVSNGYWSISAAQTAGGLKRAEGEKRAFGESAGTEGTAAMEQNAMKSQAFADTLNAGRTGNTVYWSEWRFSDGGSFPVPVKGHKCLLDGFDDLYREKDYHEYVEYMLEKGVMNGTSERKFSPELSLSRAMIVTVLWRLENPENAQGALSEPGNKFDDVEKGTWYEEAVIWASESGVVQGYGDGRFGPDEAVTREQLAVILYRYAERKGGNVSAGKDTSIFKDLTDFGVSPWAEEAVRWVFLTDLLKQAEFLGNSRIPATRLEAAVMTAKLMKSLRDF